jgi:hypothetical protein
MLLERLLSRLDRLERGAPALPLLLAWAICLPPRAALAALVGLDEEYGYFVHGRTNSAWYPLYEWLAAALWRATGGHIGLYFAAHLVLHCTIGPVVYALAKRLGLGARTAWLAVLGVAVLPYYASLGARQPQVGVAVVLFALLVLAFADWYDDLTSRRAAVLFAAAAGVAITLRPNALSTIVAFYALVLLARKPGAARRAALSLAVFAAVLLALAIHNRQAEGRFSPLTGNLGFNLYAGNNAHVSDYALRHDITSLQDTLNEALPPAYASTPPTSRDDLLRRAALEYMAAHPWRTAWNAALKTWRYVDPLLEDARLNPLHWNLAYTVPYLLYGSLALAGARLLARRGPRAALVVLVTALVSYWLPHAILFGAVRMRMTTESLLIVLAAHALAAGAGALRVRARRPPAPAAAR